jgi:hypothetical protein
MIGYFRLDDKEKIDEFSKTRIADINRILFFLLLFLWLLPTFSYSIIYIIIMKIHKEEEEKKDAQSG